jgi:hypothetical protein
VKKLLLILALILSSNAAGANAAAATGPGALALAALVAEHSPTLTTMQKREMARLFDGDLRGITSRTRSISVKADRILCRMSDVDITARSCKLSFGSKTVTLGGRLANELFATIGEAGVPSQGGAGSFFEGLKSLSCVIGPGIIRQRAGGGANCAYQPF